MAELDVIRKEDHELFQLYKLLKAKRNREVAEAQGRGEDILSAIRKEADDYFILFVSLHLLVGGNFKGYLERKALLKRRLEE